MLNFEIFWKILEILGGEINEYKNEHTFDGSSSGCSIIAWRKKTLPRQARQSIRSKAGKRSRKITPATKLHSQIL